MCKICTIFNYSGSGYAFARSLNRIFTIEVQVGGSPYERFINENTKQENYYYMFWVVAWAFIVPQVYTAIAYNKLANILTQPVRVVITLSSGVY